MILRALGVLLLLAFAASPAMTCCAHEAGAETETVSAHHDDRGHGGDERTTRPHDAVAAACLAVAGLPAEPASDVAPPAARLQKLSFATLARAEGLDLGPAAPPPKEA